LVDPVAVGAGRDELPLGAVDGVVGDDLELLLTGEVVADVVVMNLACADMGWVFYADEDRDGVATAGAEDFSAFLT